MALLAYWWDDVYLIESGAKRWILSPAIFGCRGYNSATIQGVSDTLLAAIPAGPDITSC